MSDPAADEILGRELDRLLSGQVPPPIQLDLIEAASKRSADAVKQKLEKYESSNPTTILSLRFRRRSPAAIRPRAKPSSSTARMPSAFAATKSKGKGETLART